MSVTPYVSLAELKADLQIATSDTFADAAYTAALLAATEGIDRELGRSFNKDASDVTRLYTALHTQVLNIRDLAAITSLKTDEDGDGTYEVTWATTDYMKLPLNATIDGEPWTRLEVNLANGEHRFPVGIQGGVQIVGKFGWPAVPASVKEACSIIAAQLGKRKREQPGFIITAEKAVVILRNDPQLGFLLKGLSRPKVVEN